MLFKTFFSFRVFNKSFELAQGSVKNNICFNFYHYRITVVRLMRLFSLQNKKNKFFILWSISWFYIPSRNMGFLSQLLNKEKNHWKSTKWLFRVGCKGSGTMFKACVVAANFVRITIFLQPVITCLKLRIQPYKSKNH